MSESKGQWGGRGFERGDPGEIGGGPSAGRGHARRNSSHRATASLFFGSLALFAGILLLLDRFDIVDASLVFRFWPVLMIGLGLGFLFRGRGASLLPGVILTLLGSVFLARILGYGRIEYRDLWPVVLIVVGAVVLINTLRSRREPGPLAAVDSAGSDIDSLNDVAMFGGVVKIVQTQNFRGGDLFAMFGGIEVNLRKARLAAGGPVVLNATAIMGGVELRVPDDWFIVNKGLGLLGGYSDSRRFIETESGAPADQSRTLIIRGLALMGGVDVKN
ncbi:MAG: DUF5668 domain-containing protein [Bryobacterales bacterium]|nr:DUF5668 domain-containing protein [Bryobacterales bacterium]